MEVSVTPIKDKTCTQYIKVRPFKLNHKKNLISYLAKEDWSPVFTAVTPYEKFNTFITIFTHYLNLAAKRYMR